MATGSNAEKAEGFLSAAPPKWLAAVSARRRLTALSEAVFVKARLLLGYTGGVWGRESEELETIERRARVAHCAPSPAVSVELLEL